MPPNGTSGKPSIQVLVQIDAGLSPAREGQAGVDVLAPDARRQAVAGIVHQRQRLIQRAGSGTDSTGPNTASRAMAMSGVTSQITVGW